MINKIIAFFDLKDYKKTLKYQQNIIKSYIKRQVDFLKTNVIIKTSIYNRKFVTC